MFNTVRQFVSALRLARRRLRYQQTGVWTPADAEAWAAFLRSPTGAKLDLISVNLVLDTLQDAASKGGSQFDMGVGHGSRKTWAELKMLSATGVAPEDDSN